MSEFFLIGNGVPTTSFQLALDMSISCTVSSHIDGMWSQKPYFAKTRECPQRGDPNQLNLRFRK